MQWKKTMADFWKSTRVVVVAGLIGVAANTSNLYHTYEYTQETMRGKSELTHHGDANRTGDGLEKDYITAWSYGIGETWIPCWCPTPREAHRYSSPTTKRR